MDLGPRDGPRGSTQPAADPPADGPRSEVARMLGRYIVVADAGGGGMGVVLRGYDPKLHREVALKRLHPGELTRTQVSRRSLREARAIARLSHPNVIAVYDVEQIEGSPYLIMEYVEGVTIRQWARQRAPSWREVVELFVQAARGLAAAHAAGLMHRDFKPDNVMVGADNRVRVLDFGLAREDGDGLDEGRSATSSEVMARVGVGGDAAIQTLTAAGTVMGTPAYMAPEQLTTVRSDARVDQYAWCVALWETLWGQRPFVGDLAAMLAAKRRGPPAPPSRAVPGWLVQVLVRGLAPAPAQRFPSMAALVRSVERGLGTGRTRLVVALLGLLVLVAGGVFAVWRLDRLRAQAGCDAAGASIAEVWNDARREQVRAAFVATGANYAPATFERLTPWLDEYAATWQTMRTQHCLDTLAQAPRADDLTVRADECLDDGRAALDRLVVTLGDATPSAVRGAINAATRLPRLAWCARPEALASRVAPPSDPALREQVGVVRERLADATALEAAGEWSAGLAKANATLAEARALGWLPLVAEAELRAGSLADRTGDFAAARTHLQAAYFDALAAGADLNAASAATILVFMVGNQLALHDEALAWADHAHALLRRLDEEQHALASADLAHATATVHLRRGTLDDAAAQFGRELAIVERELGPDHPWVASVLNSIATVHDRRGEYAEAIVLEERALALLERALGPDHPVVASVLVNLAAAHGSLRNRDLASTLYRRALAMQELALGPDHPEVAIVLNNLGNMEHGRGDHAEARRLHERALAIRERAFGPMHPAVATSLVNLANLQRIAQDYDAAWSTDQRALAIYETTLGRDHVDVARPCVGLGTTAYRRGQLAEAVTQLERAHALREHGAGDPGDLATIRLALARALWDAEPQGRARAIELAELARAWFAGGGEGFAGDASDATAWLAEHRL